MKNNPSSKPPASSQPPNSAKATPDNAEVAQEKIRQFISGIRGTTEETILEEHYYYIDYFLKLTKDNKRCQLLAYNAMNEKWQGEFRTFTKKLQNLGEDCGWSFWDMKREILLQLGTFQENAPTEDLQHCAIYSLEKAEAMRRDVQAVAQIEHGSVDAYALTMPSSRPPDAIPNQLHDDIDRFLATLSEAELFILFHCKSLESIVVCEKDGISVNPESALKIQVGAKELIQTYGLTESDIREPILERIMASGRPTEIVDMNITGNPIAQESIQSAVRQKTHTLVEAGVAKVQLSSEMNSEKFVKALTDKGRDMLGKLLAIWESVTDAAAMQALEKETEAIGYVSLSQHVRDRLADRIELDDILKACKKTVNPLTEKGVVPGCEMALSPWGDRPPVQSADSPTPSVAQLLREESKDNREIIEREIFSTQMPGAVTAKFFEKMRANGLNMHLGLDELKKHYSEGGLNQFVDGYTGWRRNMLIDWLDLPPDNLNAVWELVKKYKEYEKGEQHIAAPWKLEEDATELAKMIGCSMKELKQALTDNLYPKKVLIDPKGQKARRAKTILSVRKQREKVAGEMDDGFFGRLLKKKD